MMSNLEECAPGCGRRLADWPNKPLPSPLSRCAIPFPPESAPRSREPREIQPEEFARGLESAPAPVGLCCTPYRLPSLRSWRIDTRAGCASFTAGEKFNKDVTVHKKMLKAAPVEFCRQQDS